MKSISLLHKLYLLVLLSLYLGATVAQAQSAAPASCSLPPKLKQVPIPNTDPLDHLLYSYHELQYLSCDYDAVYPADPKASTVFDQEKDHLDIAKQSWVYALMASNAYRDKGRVFVIPGWELASRWESKSGLGLEEWSHKDSKGKTDEIVVAFEGTNFTSFMDWRTNLAIRRPPQYKEALAYVQCVEQRANGARVTVTGHSLGGGIALNISLCETGVDYYGFDTSPRAFYGVGSYKPATRVFIYERGEVLSILRPLWFGVLKNFKDRYWFNFMNFRGIGAAVSEHDMYLIARGLLMTAVKAKDENAARAFTANLSSKNLQDEFKDDKPADLAHDIDACQKIFRAYPAR